MPDDASLGRVAAMLPDIAAHAAALDDNPAFPQADFDALIAAGLLRATLPERHGGAGYGEGPEGADLLRRLLVDLGEVSMPVARLYEAHVNALQLVFRYGGDVLRARCADDAAAGHLFALWVTDPHGGGVRLECDRLRSAPLSGRSRESPSEKKLEHDRSSSGHALGGGVLQGAKAFCSGAGAASRALITAATPDGVRMLIVPLANARVIPSGIRLAGMRAAVTGSVDFTGVAAGQGDFLGKAGDYLREPVFSAGAWRGSAGAVGGLRALVKLHRNELKDRGRDADPHQRARFGQLVMAHETARLWLARAARRACLEDGPADEIVAYVNLARIAIESACLDAMRLTQRGLGLGAFLAGHPAERICRDLAVFLRQPAPDETLDKAAAYYFGASLPDES